jgi:hypothetical protein
MRAAKQRPGRVAVPQPCHLPAALPERDNVPCFWLQGVLYRRTEQGASTQLTPAEERSGQRLYRICEPGTYDAMLTDRVVSFICWKGQVEVIETLF